MKLCLDFFPNCGTNSIIFKEFFRKSQQHLFQREKSSARYSLLRDWTGASTKKILKIKLTTKRDIKCEPSDIKDTGPCSPYMKSWYSDINSSPPPNYWYSLEGIKYHCYRETSNKWFDWTSNKMFSSYLLLQNKLIIISKSCSYISFNKRLKLWMWGFSILAQLW